VLTQQPNFRMQSLLRRSAPTRFTLVRTFLTATRNESSPKGNNCTTDTSASRLVRNRRKVREKNLHLEVGSSLKGVHQALLIGAHTGLIGTFVRLMEMAGR
jgi:hypothetical protein